MNETPESMVAVVIRVSSPGHLAFQLRKGEVGLSVFDPEATEPPLNEDEILDAFRPGSLVVFRSKDQIARLGLDVVSCEGAESLPERLRESHCEIRPGTGMSRGDFKNALKALE